MKKQAQFFDRLAAARSRLLAVVDGLDNVVLETEPVLDHWTVKDVFGHIVSWNREFRADIGVILQGRHPGRERQISGAGDFSDWNEQRVAEKRDWSWEQMLADFEQDCKEAVQLISSLQPRDLRQRGVTPWKAVAGSAIDAPGTRDTDSVETLVNYHWRHMNQHAKALEKWRERRRQASN